jgi:Domain of unknown function DUF29
MSDLYDTDIVTWSERQAELLRRRAAGELVNEAEIDWPNVAEEIESVGNEQVNAALSQIDNIIRHRLYLLGWPADPAVRKWQVELREFNRQLRRRLTPSMIGGQEPKISEATIAEPYGAAVDYCLVHMESGPTQPLPETCPWSLNELLAEGRTA